MKAALCTAYGAPDVIQISDIPKPVPKANEVLIRIKASNVSSGDWRIQSGTFPLGFATLGRLFLGWSRPRQPILGTAFSGVIETVGHSVTRFKVGDEIIGFPGAKLGGHAEYTTMAETAALVLKPTNLSFAEAAALPFGGSTALYFLRDLGKLQPGETVLVIGASGAVGSAAVTLARHFGAEVTGVSSTANQDVLAQIGAHHCIDYKTTDIATLGLKWDIILDTSGTIDLQRLRRMLTPAGRLLLVNADLPHMLQAVLTSLFSRQKARVGVAPERSADLQTLAELAKTGVFRPRIDCILAFDDIQAAYARVHSGRKVGTVVLDHDSDTKGS